MAAIALAAVLGALLYWLFPGPRLALAFTLATGIGRDALQARIDAIEDKAIAGRVLSAGERGFLSDLYRTLATGGKLVVFARQAGRMMDHYLDGSGAAYRLEPAIFTGNAKVQRQMGRLRDVVLPACAQAQAVSSPVFYMPDRSQADSVFGLYHGTVAVRAARGPDGACLLRWRAEVPWSWPSYDSLRARYGTPHAESFPLPNLQSLFLGSRHALRVDNGLGEHLARVGLARPFLAYAQWEERVEPE